MSYLIATPDVVTTAAAHVADIGSSIRAANLVALAPTSTLMAAAGDEVSAAIASLFSGHAQEYQAIGARAAVFHEQFVQALSAASGRMRPRRRPMPARCRPSPRTFWV